MTLFDLEATAPSVHTDIRRRRLVYYFDSADSAYNWAWSHMPKYPPGPVVTVCPPRAKKEGPEMYILRYTVTFPGHAKYYTLLKNGMLMEE